MSLESDIIFVDESGDPGLSRKSIEMGKYFVLGFVYCKSPSLMRKKLKRLLKRLHQSKKYPIECKELKCYLPRSDLISKGVSEIELDKFQNYMFKNRDKMIRILNETCGGVYAAVCDKEKAKESWTSERLGNYVFAQTLVVNVLPLIRTYRTPIIIYDKGRLSAAKSKDFKIYLMDKDRYFQNLGIKKYPGNLGTPIDFSSLNEPGLWASDIVAGAFRHFFNNNEPKYKEALKPSFLGKTGYRLFWDD